MSQLAIAELRARLDARQDLPTQAAKMLIFQLDEAVAELGTDLHLEAIAGIVDGGKAVVVFVAVFVVGVARCAWSWDVLGARGLRDPFSA